MATRVPQRPDPAQQLIPVDPRHANVTDQDIGLALLDGSSGFVDGDSDRYVRAAFRQHGTDQIPGIGLVITTEGCRR